MNIPVVVLFVVIGGVGSVIVTVADVMVVFGVTVVVAVVEYNVLGRVLPGRGLSPQSICSG